jgi:molecular chaperone Hsp33
MASPPRLPLLARRLQRLAGRDHMICAEVHDCRVSVVDCTRTLAEARRRFGLCNTVSHVLGDLMACTILHSSMLSGEERTIARLTGSGLMRSAYVEAIRAGEVRGFAEPTRIPNGVPLSDALGPGVLQVDRIVYNRHSPVTSVVASDGDAVAAWRLFYRDSEQIATFLHVETQVHNHNSVEREACFGLLAQSMPASDRMVKQSGLHTIERLESSRQYHFVTQQSAGVRWDLGQPGVDAGGWSILRALFDLSEAEESVVAQTVRLTPIDFFCRCSKATFEAKLAILATADLRELQQDGGLDLTCSFCNNKYRVEHDELAQIIHRKGGGM